MRAISIRGARANNLKGFDLSLPKNAIVVATGVSGSGKSSLVFDILFEEGRRQYLRSLGILSGLGDERDFDSISGLGPTIAVQQGIIRQSNPRSTVGSRTQILGMLGVLYAAEGRIECSSCGALVGADLRCGGCGHQEERLEPRFFSYNAPDGMCLKCAGRGASREIDLGRLVPDQRTTLGEVFTGLGMTPGYARLLRRHLGDHVDTPFAQLPEDVKREAIHGHYTGGDTPRRSYCLTKIFEGRLRREGRDPSGLYRLVTCAECNGFRIGAEARRVRLGGKHIGELATLTITEATSFLEGAASEASTPFSASVIEEILGKARALVASRLGHLTLYRELPTLSGGELQRLFLAGHLDSGLDSLIYILDEPTVGLHESEKADLLRSITALKDLRNTVIVVEHDRSTIELADHVVDIGPGAGVEGGRVVYQGDVAGLLASDDSITGRYLSGRAAMPRRRLDGRIVGDPEPGRSATLASTTPLLTVRNATTNNLKGVTVSFPLGVLVGIAGVSGSGKSSLIADTLVPLLAARFRDQRDVGATGVDDEESEEDDPTPLHVEAVAGGLEGVEHLTGFAEVSQAPIGRSPSSNPATYVGIWDPIRALFARQPDAIARGFAAGHFSFNAAGACSRCGGSGQETTILGGSLRIYTRCRVCDGRRYNEEALSVRFQNKTIADVLEMRVSEAVAFFAGEKKILPTLEVMERIGMGYIGLGQPTPSLSGGESQRIKLAREIGRRRKGSTLYLLDEPTTGLSLYDIAKLIELLDELVRSGNSAIVVEHDPVVLAACDWIVELGPEGGTGGGRVIAEGPPDSLRKNPNSVIAPYLPEVA